MRLCGGYSPNPAVTLHFCTLAFWECFDHDEVAWLCGRSVGKSERPNGLLFLGSVCETLDERDERRDDMTGLDGKPGLLVSGPLLSSIGERGVFVFLHCTIDVSTHLYNAVRRRV